MGPPHNHFYMLLPSLTIGYINGKPEVLFVGADADKAKESYRANAENPKFDAIQLFVRPEHTRQTTPKKQADRAKRASENANAAQDARDAAEKAKADAEAKEKQPAKRKADK